MWVLRGPFDGKEGDENTPTKDKLLKTGTSYVVGRKEQDLIIRHKKISRKHVRFVISDFPEDKLADPDFVPQLWLEVLSDKKEVSRKLERPKTGEVFSVTSGSAQFEMEDGDVVHMVTGIPVTVRWERISCYLPSTKGTPAISLQACASVGISITPAPHNGVTHHLTLSYTLTPEIAQSLLTAAHLVKPDWLCELLRRGESSHGRSALEDTYSLPDPASYPPSFSPSLPQSPSLRKHALWRPDEGRAGMLRELRFIFLGEKGREVREVMRDAVKVGGAEYECCSVEGGRRALHQVLARGAARDGDKRMVLVADEQKVKAAVGEDGWREFKEEAEIFELRFVRQEQVIEAIVRIDIARINEGGKAAISSAPTSTLPDVIPNTYPEEPSIPPNTSKAISQVESTRKEAPQRASSPEPAAVPEASIPESAPAAETPIVRMPPIRRVGRQRIPILGIDDLPLMLDTSDDALVTPVADLGTGTTSRPAESEAPASASTDIPLPTASQRAPRRPLKRRASTQTPISSLFALDEHATMHEEEPKHKRFKALYEASDPDRYTQSAFGTQSGVNFDGSDLYSQLPRGPTGESATQSETGISQLLGGGVSRLAAVAEEEEESQSAAQMQTQMDSGLTQTFEKMGPGTKRKRQATTGDGDVEMAEGTQPNAKRRAIENFHAVRTTLQQSQPSTVIPTQPTITPTQSTFKSSEARLAQKAQSQKLSGAAAGKPDTDEAFLTAVASTRRGKKAEDTFDREFNNLRISKPELEHDQEQTEWAVLDDFGNDGNVRGNFMVIVEMDLPRRSEGPGSVLRASGGRTDWEGRPDFKKFKRKALPGRQRTVDLFVDDQDDYGMGPQYWKDSAPHLQSKTHKEPTAEPELSAPTRAQSQRPSTQPRTQSKRKGKEITRDDSDEETAVPASAPTSSIPARSTSRASSVIPAPVRRVQSRQKAQPLFIESDEDDGEASQKAVFESDGASEMRLEEIDSDLDGGMSSTLKSSSVAGPSESQASRRSARTKKPTAVAVVADDSDHGGMFKGFGVKRRTRRK
ncbi:hypothetical protein WOLCODRAFT_106435 [Wolfiporia cocos MD-104 SS10]|uniref:Uncharacterized protein n=1 Tax=Wolfiporia cocos (strain MD-104) TaxID=742152 RepID=A0A2H3IXK7_WOLCO|nr:hypothetical protein WOLCODRAFT_106435 [Wolfiporia cocos MD-104 SS10]